MEEGSPEGTLIMEVTLAGRHMLMKREWGAWEREPSALSFYLPESPFPFLINPTRSQRLKSQEDSVCRDEVTPAQSRDKERKMWKGRQQRVSSVRAPFLAFCDRDCRLCHRIPLSGMQTHQWASLDHEDEGREAAESLTPKDTGLLP